MASLLLPDARVDEADWYTAALTDFGARVANIIPGGYPAYARILHPATASGGERVTWAQVAASAGTVVHPLAQFPAVAGRLYSRLTGPAGWLGSNPLEGSLDLFQLRILCSILSDDTIAGERCWATFWEGWGNLPARWRETWPRIKQPHRAYFLFERPVAEIVSLAVDVAYLGHSSPSFRILTSTVETQDAGKAHSPARRGSSMGPIPEPVVAEFTGVVCRHRDRLRLHPRRRIRSVDPRDPQRRTTRSVPRDRDRRPQQPRRPHQQGAAWLTTDIHTCPERPRTTLCTLDNDSKPAPRGVRCLCQVSLPVSRPCILRDSNWLETGVSGQRNGRTDGLSVHRARCGQCCHTSPARRGNLMASGSRRGRRCGPC